MGDHVTELSRDFWPLLTNWLIETVDTVDWLIETVEIETVDTVDWLIETVDLLTVRDSGHC